jgi:hypothetical protein
MRTRFVRALLVTICAFLEIKDSARIDAYRLRIDSAILRIVSPCLRTVRPKLADTEIHLSFVTGGFPYVLQETGRSAEVVWF